MWIKTGKHHINTDKIQHTEILPSGAIRLVFENGFITLKNNEALEMTTYLDSVYVPSWSLIPEELEDEE